MDQQSKRVVKFILSTVLHYNDAPTLKQRKHLWEYVKILSIAFIRLELQTKHANFFESWLLDFYNHFNTNINGHYISRKDKKRRQDMFFLQLEALFDTTQLIPTRTVTMQVTYKDGTNVSTTHPNRIPKLFILYHTIVFTHLLMKSFDQSLIGDVEESAYSLQELLCLAFESTSMRARESVHKTIPLQESMDSKTWNVLRTDADVAVTCMHYRILDYDALVEEVSLLPGSGELHADILQHSEIEEAKWVFDNTGQFTNGIHHQMPCCQTIVQLDTTDNEVKKMENDVDYLTDQIKTCSQIGIKCGSCEMMQTVYISPIFIWLQLYKE